jgi:hypothetical protein
MLYADFEAILDGMVGVPEFADKEVRGAYCLVNGQLRVRSLVLFTIDFDEDGMADTTWNVPLRHLAEHAGQGPDMGAGPIRLACRSQCPVAWHQDQMWDPGMKPGANDFIAIRDTIRERGPKLGLEIDDELDSTPAAAPPVIGAETAAPTIPRTMTRARKRPMKKGCDWLALSRSCAYGYRHWKIPSPKKWAGSATPPSKRRKFSVPSWKRSWCSSRRSNPRMGRCVNRMILSRLRWSH